MGKDFSFFAEQAPNYSIDVALADSTDDNVKYAIVVASIADERQAQWESIKSTVRSSFSDPSALPSVSPMISQVGVEDTSIAGSSALKVTFTLSMQGESMAFEAYYLYHGNSVNIVMLTNRQTSGSRQVLKDILDSLRFTS